MPPSTAAPCLVLALDPLREHDRDWVVGACAGEAALLELDENAPPSVVAETWSRRSVQEFFDADLLRAAFLDFLEQWPTRALVGERVFDQLLTGYGGYSAWWCGAGSRRHPDKGVFLQYRAVWLAARAMDAVSPRRVILHCRDRAVAQAIASRCRAAAIAFEATPGSGAIESSPFTRRHVWLARSLAWVPVALMFRLLRAGISRMLTGRSSEPVESRGAPTVVLSCTVPRQLRQTEQGTEVWFWSDLAAALEDTPEPPRVRYLPHVASLDGRIRSLAGSWRLLRGDSRFTPVPESYGCLRDLPPAAARQVRRLLRYASVEGTAGYRQSFTQDGCDLAPLYVPVMRTTIASMLSAELAIAGIVRSLRALGNVRMLGVSEEFYDVGRFAIAAARQCGIPTVGVQHGTIFPLHLVYTLPPGQVALSPVPDYFAAYGEYAREVLSTYGAYPSDRVWVVGGPRLDWLVNSPPDRDAARARLGLPAAADIILLATQNYPWFQAVAQALLEVTRERPGCVVCIKTHPKDVPLETYREMAVQANAANVAFYDLHFDDLLAACDILVSGSSTAVFEAILLDRDPIVVNFTAEPDRYPYATEGAAVAARSPRELAVAVERLLGATGEAGRKEGRERFLERHAGPTARGAAAAALAGRIRAACADSRGCDR